MNKSIKKFILSSHCYTLCNYATCWFPLFFFCVHSMNVARNSVHATEIRSIRDSAFIAASD